MALARLKSVAGVTIPDTVLCNAAVDLLESSSPGFLCTHCLRTYIFGSPQRLPRIIGTPAALIHILIGQPLNPREAERKGLVHETSAARLSIARWRLRGACRRIRRNRSPTSSVSSATPPRRRWRRDWRLN